MEEVGVQPATIDAYIAQCPAEVQTILVKLRAVIREAAPEAEERISYRMPGFYLNGKPLVWFAAYARHIGFYPTPEGIEAFEGDLMAYKRSKGAIQFPLNQPMPYELISRITAFRAAQNLEK
jgi:uncharacterized protein YdhG (YjbR/CyaY superfamily)